MMVHYCKEWDEVYSSGFETAYPFESVIKFVKGLKRHHAPGTRVLEVGCGSGGNMWCIWKEGFSAHGLEPSKVAVEKFNKYASMMGIEAHVQCKTIQDMDYEDNYFVGIVDRATISHVGTVSDGADAVKRLSSKLVRGGRMLFTPFSDRDAAFRNTGHMGGGVVNGESRGSVANFGSICFYGRRDIFDVAAASNMEIVSATHVERLSILEDGAMEVHANWEVIMEKVK